MALWNRAKNEEKRRGRGSRPLRHQEVARHLHMRAVNQCKLTPARCARAHTYSSPPHARTHTHRAHKSVLFLSLSLSLLRAYSIHG